MFGPHIVNTVFHFEWGSWFWFYENTLELTTDHQRCFFFFFLKASPEPHLYLEGEGGLHLFAYWYYQKHIQQDVSRGWCVQKQLSIVSLNIIITGFGSQLIFDIQRF